jgi:hypothetical protein
MGDERNELVLHRVELAQLVVRGALLLEQSLVLFERKPHHRDVADESLDMRGTPGVVADDHRVVVHPQLAPVARDHPVLEGLRAGALAQDTALLGDPLAIVGMNELEEDLRILLPLVQVVPEHRPDLRADEIRARVVERAEVRESRQSLHERAVELLCMTHLALCRRKHEVLCSAEAVDAERQEEQDCSACKQHDDRADDQRRLRPLVRPLDRLGLRCKRATEPTLRRNKRGCVQVAARFEVATARDRKQLPVLDLIAVSEPNDIRSSAVARE